MDYEKLIENAKAITQPGEETSIAHVDALQNFGMVKATSPTAKQDLEKLGDLSIRIVGHITTQPDEHAQMVTFHVNPFDPADGANMVRGLMSRLEKNKQNAKIVLRMTVRFS